MSDNNIYRVLAILKNGQAVRLLFKDSTAARAAHVILNADGDGDVRDDFGARVNIRRTEIAAVIMQDEDLASQGDARMAMIGARTQTRAQRAALADPLQKAMSSIALPGLPERRN